MKMAVKHFYLMLKICCTQLKMEFSNEKQNQYQAYEELLPSKMHTGICTNGI